MRQKEQLFIEIREDFVGTVVALCFFSVLGRMVRHLSCEVRGFNGLFVLIGACLH